MDGPPLPLPLVHRGQGAFLSQSLSGDAIVFDWAKLTRNAQLPEVFVR
jgi:hypothetical protein